MLIGTFRNTQIPLHESDDSLFMNFLICVLFVCVNKKGKIIKNKKKKWTTPSAGATLVVVSSLLRVIVSF